MAEQYITKLQRERGELLAYVRATMDWHASMDHAAITGRKGEAYRIVDEKRAALDAAYKIIEPLLAE